MRHLTLEDKIIIFKTKVKSHISKVPTEIISELERIQKLFCGLVNQK